MAQQPAFRKALSAAAGALVSLLPVSLSAEGLSLLADLEYFYNSDKSTAKETGIVTTTESTRFSQLYQVDISRLVYPNLSLDFGGIFENEDFGSSRSIIGEPEISSDNSEKTIRPYIEAILNTPLYKAGLAYRVRDVETSGNSVLEESFMVKEYNASLNWRPVDLPLLNMFFERIELEDDPLTTNATRDTLNLVSKYLYRDFSFDYAFVSQKNLDNLEGSGSQINTHNGRIRYAKGFDVYGSHFDVNGGAKIIYNKTEFINAENGDVTIDRPASGSGSPFYISNDSPPTSNEPFDLTLVGGGNQLTGINIGRDGGLNPVSAGLGFGSPAELDTIYLYLSQDTEQFPDLASSSQVATIAGLYNWRFYSSDDQLELDWTEQPISSAIYNGVDNRFEIRLAVPVSARQVKVTTTPLTVVAPGEIRYSSIRALTSVSGSDGQAPENLDQYYDFGVQWSPGPRTSIGYNFYYRDQEAKDIISEKTSLTNNLFFRQTLNPIFLTYGRLSHEQRNRTQEQGSSEETDLTYSLGLKAAYLDTLSQSLVFTGADSSGTDGSGTTNSILLRTDADLYTGWSANLDLGYAWDSLLDGDEQTTRTLRFNTNIVPNNSIDINLDYSISLTDQADQESSTTQYGTVQVLWVLTDTLNMFFRYNFRNQQGRNETTTYLREFNINWAPFPDGDLQFSIDFNESRDFGDLETRSISPTVTWKIARGLFLDLRYNTGTLDSPVETSDIDSVVAKLRLFY